VRAKNHEHDALLKEIEESQPDVVIVVEFSRHWYTAFKTSPILAPYVYGTAAKSHQSSVNVFSRIPIASDTRAWVGDRAVETVEIPLGSRTLRVIGLHAVRPEFKRDFDYNDYWSEAIPMLFANKGPLVVIGDFNATEHSLVYQQLTAGRLRSAHDDRGRGWATTWPNGEWLLPPIRIDQAFLSPEVECVRIIEGMGRGSDHKPLILDVRLRPDQVSFGTSAGTASN
jgi:endonuclease/exonuclease/phosphatase (EEP) superfamily protein YafD